MSLEVACSPWWTAPPEDEAELADQVEAMVADHTARFGYTPGLALAIVAEGEEVLRHVSGDRGPDSGEALTGAMPIPMASATKVLTSLLVMQEVERGALALDDAIGDLVPDLPTAMRPILVEQLLTHTDGLGDGHENPAMAELAPEERAAFTFRDYVEVAAAVEPHFPPGERARYSQTGFVLLAMAVEELAGIGYEARLQQVLDDLAMPSTGFANAYTPFQGYTSRVYERDGEGFVEVPLEYTRADVATAALVSSLDDLVALQAAVQRGEVVAEDTLADMMSDQPAKGGWGLGWERTTKRGFALSGHSGGQSAVFELGEDGRCGGVFLSDSSSPELLDLGYEVAAKAAQWGAR